MRARVRVSPEAIASCDGAVRVSGDEGHHLARVTRVRVGESVVLFDGDGHERDATVREVLRGEVVVNTVGELRAGVGCDRAGVVWLQGVPKGDKMELVVRQATELGARAVVPVFTARTVPQERADREAKRVTRWQAIADEAARQCGRADGLRVHAPVTLDAALAAVTASLRLLAWEEAHAPLGDVVRAGDVTGGCAVLAGPEGGLTADEAARARAQGFVAVSLGPRIWRAETVAPAMLGMLSVLCGDLA